MAPSPSTKGVGADSGNAAAAAIISSMLDTFCSMIKTKNPALIDELWSDGGFSLVGSERGEICLTREQVEAKLEVIFSSPRTLILEIGQRRISIVGNAGWIFAEAILRRQDAAGLDDARKYLAMCIFEKVEGTWRWRQFFGSEPY